MFLRRQSARAQVERDLPAKNQGQDPSGITILRSPRPPQPPTFLQIARITRPDVIDEQGTLTFGLCSLTPVVSLEEQENIPCQWPILRPAGTMKYLHTINSLRSLR